MFESISEIANFMMEKGVKFKSVKVTGAPSYTYAITESGCCIRIIKRGGDGVHGIVFFCHRDREDVDRIKERLNKEIYDTWDETRPYKVVIEPSEMEEVTEILLENENNRQDSKELEI